MVDRRGLGPRVRKDVGVQIPPRAENMMNEDYDKIEEDLKKKKNSKKKEQKVSGRSVFKLKEIIQKKAKSFDETQDKEKNLDEKE